MKLLQERILQDGIVLPHQVLKVGSFLNQCMDISLYEEMAKEFQRRFADCQVNKILTVEASGIGIAVMAAQAFGCNAVFAKKGKSLNVSGDVYSARAISYTHGDVNTLVVEKAYLSAADRVLLIDDFLASGEALRALRALALQSGCTLVGAGIAIEKAFQSGGDALRAEGLRIESLARIRYMDDAGHIEFC